MISPSTVSPMASASAAPPSPYRTRSVLTLAEDACGAGPIAQNIASALGTVGLCTVEQFYKAFEAAGALLSLEELAAEAKRQALTTVACILLPKFSPLHGDSAQLHASFVNAMYNSAKKLLAEADKVAKSFSMLHKLALANPSVLPTLPIWHTTPSLSSAAPSVAHCSICASLGTSCVTCIRTT